MAPKLSKDETRILRDTFAYLHSLMPKLGSSRLITDQTHFYTLITSLIRVDLVSIHGAAGLKKKLLHFSKILDQRPTKIGDEEFDRRLKEYRELAEKQTTDARRRAERDRLFVEIIQLIPA